MLLTASQRAWVRDVPRSCCCLAWRWTGQRWVLLTPRPDCPWHNRRPR